MVQLRQCWWGVSIITVDDARWDGQSAEEQVARLRRDSDPYGGW